MLIFFSHQGCSLLGPMNEISRSGDSDIVGLTIPLGVSKNVGAVFALDDARIFDPSRPFLTLLRVDIGIENGSRLSREVDTIVARSQAEAGGVHADGHG